MNRGEDRRRERQSELIKGRTEQRERQTELIERRTEGGRNRLTY